MNKWNICSTNCYKIYENLKFTISELWSETKNMWIWKPLYEKSLTPPKGWTFRSESSGLRILVSFSNPCETKGRYREGLWHWEEGRFQRKHTHTNIIIIPYSHSYIWVWNATLFIIAHAWIKFQNRFWVRTL